MSELKKSILYLLFCYFSFYFPLMGQAAVEKETSLNNLKKEAPRVYIDCTECDVEYIKTEITFVNYVWDRKEADVHILITTQRTASGGREYTITFLGKGRFKDLQNTLKYYAKSTDSWEQKREGLVRTLKLGLVPYIARSPLRDYVSVEFKEKVKPTAVEDKWNFWVFSIGLHSYLRGEQKYKRRYLWSNFTANRVTPESKFSFDIHGNFEESEFKVNEDEVKSSSKQWGINTLYVKSINEHWSAGGWLNFSHSTYRNLDSSYEIAPALEYDFFPYSQATRRQLRFLYKISLLKNKYIEQTLYEKTSEILFRHSLSITLELKEVWGDASFSVEGSQYLHDLTKNRLRVYSNLDIRIFKGLSFSLFGIYSAIHDQLNLPKGEATLEEILLRRRELESNYMYSFSIGLSYKFGSIYSNVVNPRFGYD